MIKLKRAAHYGIPRRSPPKFACAARLKRPELTLENPDQCLHSKFTHIERFADEIVAATQARLSAVLERRHAGQENDRRFFELRECTDLCAKVEPVHFGEADIEEDEFELAGV